MRRWGMLWLLVGGCDLFNTVKDTVEGVLEPQVAIGLVVVLDPEGSDLVDLDELGLTAGVAGTVFLADARDVADLEEAPVTGATMSLSGCGASAALNEEADGTYALVSPTDLDGCEGPVLTLRRDDVDPGLQVPFTIPGPPTLTIPARWTAGDPLTIPLSTAGYDGGIVVVIDATSGDVVFSNEPQDIRGYYELLTKAGDVEDVVVPGTAFEEDKVYGVLVTGLIKVPNRDVDEANTALSVLDAGRARLYGLTTADVQ